MGAWYGTNGNAHYFGYQITGMVIIFTWTSLFAITYFLLMHVLGLLRVDRATEILGLDLRDLGGLSEADWSVITEEV